MFGGGLARPPKCLTAPMRHSSDLFSLVDSHLVVTIPYISTLGEKRRKKRIIISSVLVLFAVILAVAALVAFRLATARFFLTTDRQNPHDLLNNRNLKRKLRWIKSDKLSSEPEASTDAEPTRLTSLPRPHCIRTRPRTAMQSHLCVK